MLDVVDQCGHSGPPNKQVADMVKREKERVEEEGAPLFLPSLVIDQLELGTINVLALTHVLAIIFQSFNIIFRMEFCYS